jgi:ABC-type multidrug transport system fused ATPase/permease subunit
VYNNEVFVDKNGVLMRAFSLLSSRDRYKLILVAFIQVLLAVFDLIGVGLIGVISSLTITGIQSTQPGNRVNDFLEFLNLQNFSLQHQIILISIISAFFFISKTVLSIFFLKRSLIFLGARSAQLSGELTNYLVKKEYSYINGKSKQELIFNLTGGTNSLIIGVLGSLVTILSDLVLITVMLSGLFYIDFGIAIGSLFFFSTVLLFLSKKSSSQARKLGQKSVKYNIQVNELISNLIDTFRELFTRGVLSDYSKQIMNLRKKAALVNSQISLIPYINKYVMEILVVIGVLILVFTQSVNQEPSRAAGNLAIFLAAATRIIPSILRLQQGFLQIRLSYGGAIPTLSLYDEIKVNSSDSKDNENLKLFSTEKFEPNVVLEKVNYMYPKSKQLVINSVSLEIKSGSFVAIVGKSGAGKSTFVNILLGVLQPQSGLIRVSGLTPQNAVNKWPGSIAYVPQNIEIIGSTIANNISLNSNNNDEFNESKVWNSLKIAQLENFVKSLPLGLNTLVGDKGAKLSGGQRQRLGIARAFYSNPELVILDEATSALDAETEQALSTAIQSLRGSVTLIVVAHRLSTIKSADLVCYLDHGSIAALGTFEEVREQVPDFNKQINLMKI